MPNDAVRRLDFPKAYEALDYASHYLATVSTNSDSKDYAIFLTGIREQLVQVRLMLEVLEIVKLAEPDRVEPLSPKTFVRRRMGIDL
jgi:hypothetical protein